MERIYGRQDDMHTLVVKAYADPSLNLYEDAEFTKPITTEKLREMFLIGLVVETEAGLGKMLGYGVEDGKGFVYTVMPVEGQIMPVIGHAVDPA